MPDYTLLLLEVTDIQDYVFKSNHLAQNIGASELVEMVTEEWLVETLEKESLQSNVTWDEDKSLQYHLEKRLPNSELDVELVYRGGGVAMLLFTDKKNARKFLESLTRKTLEEAPGLQPVAIYEQFDWEKDSLDEKHQKLRRKLAARKLDRQHSTPLAGLGVTARCVFTGMPAVGWDDDPGVVGYDAAARKKRLGDSPKRISAEVAQKLKHSPRAQNRLFALAPEVRQQGFEFATNFNDFGEKGTSSYIAVIHADGNAMGKRFDKIGKDCHAPANNGDYVQKLRAFSVSIEDNAREALRETIDYLLAHWGEYEEKAGALAKRKSGDKKLLPFRPIVFGGDDVTFVSEGRMGLTLAAKYLERLSTKRLDDSKPPFARAGVAIVKSHYPFSRAYGLAEKLAAEAKKKIDYLVQPDEGNTFVMDWHFSTTGVEAGLHAIREREFATELGKSLLMRPVRVAEIKGKTNIWRTWQTFSRLVDRFQNSDEWSGRRNKVRALHNALRQGQEAVKLFLRNYGLERLPEIPGLENMATTGWQGDDCGYFDAIEAMDFVIAFNENTNGEES